MPKVFRWVGYAVLFCVCFLFFVYWMFPMDALKDRVIAEMEKGLGPSYEVSIDTLNTRWLSGLKMKSFRLMKRDGGQVLPVWKAKEVKAGVSLFSLLFGGMKVYFDVEMEQGNLSGRLQRKGVNWFLRCDLSNVDLKDFPITKTAWGLNATSDVDGTIDFSYDPAQPLKTSGNVALKFNKLEFLDSEIKLGEMGTFSLPSLLFSKGNSKFEAEINHGAMNLKGFQFAGGDLELNLAGKVYLAQTLDRYRLNLHGDFGMSPKLSEAISLVTAFIEKQKGDDGKYPLSITGPVSQPNIKIGAMSLPL